MSQFQFFLAGFNFLKNKLSYNPAVKYQTTRLFEMFHLNLKYSVVIQIRIIVKKNTNLISMTSGLGRNVQKYVMN